ncbi:DUF2029 domain-containing protein, partial [Patescibacteria group bacterium]|nr:DUF2029 domain-containing protein [Patescibacteria group bacterium]
FLPVYHTLWTGQLSIFLALILLLLFMNLESDNALRSGLISFLMLIKLQYLILLPFLLLLTGNKKRFMLGLILSSIVLLFLSVYISGWHSLWGYPQFLLQTEKVGFGSNLSGMLTFHVAITDLSLLSNSLTGFSFVGNAVVYFATLVIFTKRYKEVGLRKSFVSAVLFSIVFSVHSWPHDLTLLLVPIFILFDSALSKNGVNKNLDLFFGVLLFLLPMVRHLFKSYYLSFAMFATGFYYLYSEEHWKSLAKTFVTRVKKRI